MVYLTLCFRAFYICPFMSATSCSRCNMAEFQANISDPKDYRAYKRTLSESDSSALIGRSIGDEIDGIFVSLPGYRLQITGGSDGSGIPMRPGLAGGQRKRMLLSHSTGFRPQRPGQRKRKMVRGKELGAEITQLNLKIVEYGPKTVEELLGAEG